VTPVHLAHVGQEAGGDLPPAGRRVQLPEGHRPLVPGEVPLQPRPQRALLQVSMLQNFLRQ
jgi:hypothetical protein